MSRWRTPPIGGHPSLGCQVSGSHVRMGHLMISWIWDPGLMDLWVGSLIPDVTMCHLWVSCCTPAIPCTHHTHYAASVGPWPHSCCARVSAFRVYARSWTWGPWTCDALISWIRGHPICDPVSRSDGSGLWICRCTPALCLGLIYCGARLHLRPPGPPWLHPC